MLRLRGFFETGALIGFNRLRNKASIAAGAQDRTALQAEESPESAP
jgi:hypothetical protein